jgi:hypothetical protein
VVGAALANVRRAARAGLQHVTMQLARNVFPDRIRARERTLARKLSRCASPTRSRTGSTRDEILELYLSHIYFGNGARGVEAAARHYFGTSASRLTLARPPPGRPHPRAERYDPRRLPGSGAREARPRAHPDGAAGAACPPPPPPPRARCPWAWCGAAPPRPRDSGLARTSRRRCAASSRTGWASASTTRP